MMYFQNTPWIDASFLYGSSDDRMRELRTLSEGRLKSSIDRRGRMWPAINADEEEDGKLRMEFGDSRGDVHPGATVVIAAFLRQHNAVADKLAEINPHWQDEKIFQVKGMQCNIEI